MKPSFKLLTLCFLFVLGLIFFFGPHPLQIQANASESFVVYLPFVSNSDASRIAFACWEESRHFPLCVIHANGTNQTQLTTPEIITSTASPAWSPDGTQIAFIGEVGDTTQPSYRIYTIDADGSNLSPVPNTDLAAYGLSWSPDGVRLAFSVFHDNQSDIYVIKTDGSDLTRLTNDPASDRDPAWSPDGQLIAFASNRRGPFGIYRMNADGSNQQLLGNPGFEDLEPAWSPNGSQLAFTRYFTDSSTLYLMNADGTGEHPILSSQSHEYFSGPSWSPVGQRLGFLKLTDRFFSIYIANLDGTNRKILAISGDRLAWTP